MAVDSLDKRKSALNFGRFNSVVLPTADSDVDAADKQWLWGLYSGIATAITAEDICMAFSSVTTCPSITAFAQSCPSVSAKASSRTSIRGDVDSGC